MVLGCRGLIGCRGATPGSGRKGLETDIAEVRAVLGRIIDLGRF
jgi:hypothetical protein